MTRPQAAREARRIDADEIIAALDAWHTGPDTWRAHCPCSGHAHGDARASLDIRVTADGRVLMICRSRCHRYGEVLAALGMGPVRGATPPTARRTTPLAEARRESILRARRQPWARAGVRLRYAIADWLHAADHLARLVTERGDCAATWNALAIVAEVERIAHALLAALDDEERGA